jgi:hypothetical protein
VYVEFQFDRDDTTILSEKENMELFAEDRIWSIKPKRKPRGRRSAVATEDKPLPQDIQALSSLPGPNDTTSPDEQALEEMEDVVSRLEHGVSMGSWNLFDAIAGVELGVLTEPEVSIAPSPPPSPILSSTEIVKPLTTPATHVRSALKGSRPSTPSSGTPKKPYVSINEFATIFSEHAPPTEAPHNQYTLAELARHNHTYYRSSPTYYSSTWASPDGSEKANTSFHKMSWTLRERMIERSDGEDDGGRGADDAEFNFTWNLEDTEALHDFLEPKLDAIGGTELVAVDEEAKIDGREIQLAFRPKPAGSFLQRTDEMPDATSREMIQHPPARTNHEDTDKEVILHPTIRTGPSPTFKPRPVPTHKCKNKFGPKVPAKPMLVPKEESNPVPSWLELTTTTVPIIQTCSNSGGVIYGVGERESER